MTKTQNSKQAFLRHKQNNTSGSSAPRDTSSSAPPVVGSTNSGAQTKNKHQHQRWNNKKRFGTQKRKPAAVTVGPTKQYLSVCCGAAATKPRCGTKVTVQDPESHKMKDKPLGLGHFRCSVCKKVCKVTVHAPVKAEAPVATPTA